jgi:RNA 2',3'-cyclic 3'-phosphodiesterase
VSADDAGRLRLFVALMLPMSWKAYLTARARELERLAPGYARWVAPDLMHLTLVFLGWQPAERLPAVMEATEAGARMVPPFELALGRLGHFGGWVPRVLWVEARASEGYLQRLHAALCEQLAARELVFDAKPLVPHLTLGRAQRQAGPAAGRGLAARMANLRWPTPPAPFTVREIALIRSELSPRGPRYTEVGQYLLG